ncbi:MAG: hypothetical protein F6K55_38055 [Moorea sp. SIO4A3]|nr:hypothetical protein [Moorena sp. SIO4A3]
MANRPRYANNLQPWPIGHATRTTFNQITLAKGHATRTTFNFSYFILQPLLFPQIRNQATIFLKQF